jgi:hypothetical protein
MGDLVDFQEYRDKKEEEEVEHLREHLHHMIEGMEFVDQHGYYVPLEDAINAYESNFTPNEEPEPEAPKPNFSTSRWDHFLKMMDALWLAFRHFWRLIWGPSYEIFH